MQKNAENAENMKNFQKEKCWKTAWKWSKKRKMTKWKGKKEARKQRKTKPINSLILDFVSAKGITPPSPKKKYGNEKKTSKIKEKRKRERINTKMERMEKWKIEKMEKQTWKKKQWSEWQFLLMTKTTSCNLKQSWHFVLRKKTQAEATGISGKILTDGRWGSNRHRHQS